MSDRAANAFLLNLGFSTVINPIRPGYMELGQTIISGHQTVNGVAISIAVLAWSGGEVIRVGNERDFSRAE